MIWMVWFIMAIRYCQVFQNSSSGCMMKRTGGRLFGICDRRSRPVKCTLWCRYHKKPSIMFNHDPCFGVKININRPGIVARNALTFLLVWTVWLSRITRIISPSGYFSLRILRKSIKSSDVCLSRTNGTASPVRRSIAANRETVPSRLY